jgi:hypothetical protein
MKRKLMKKIVEKCDVGIQIKESVDYKIISM